MKGCKKCGNTKLIPGIRYCLQCGTDVQTVEVKRCLDCGEKLIPGVKYCFNCGANIEEQENRNERVITVATIEEDIVGNKVITKSRFDVRLLDFFRS